jgi:hypothetical protein
MKRWGICGATIVMIVVYMSAYTLLPVRLDASRFRNAEVFVHTREFRRDFEARLF